MPKSGSFSSRYFRDGLSDRNMHKGDTARKIKARIDIVRNLMHRGGSSRPATAPATSGNGQTGKPAPVQYSTRPGGSIGVVSTPDPEDLVVNTATEVRPVPVAFGTVRLVGNFIRYDNDTFKSKAITKTTTIPGTPTASGNPVDAGKGGGSSRNFSSGASRNFFNKLKRTTPTPSAVIPPADPPPVQVITTTPPDYVFTKTIGYNYFLTFDLAICVGPIDEVVNMRATPGESSLTNDVAIEFATDGMRSFRCDDGEGFSGTMFLYNGAELQERRSDDVYDDGIGNRHVAIAHFKNFGLGQSPSPKTVMFEVRRFPRPVDAAGTALTDFPTRGAATDAHPSYYDANPAAALWEILTNDNWGANIPQAQLDVDSFRTAAQFFEAQNIGISLTLTSDAFVQEIIRHITETCACLLVWTGAELRLTCLMDTATAHANVTRLTEDQVIEPELTRGSWASTFNELRMTFVNRDQGFGTEVIHVQDLASINSLGRIQGTKIEAPVFGNRQTAEEQARRMLNEIAYPKGRLNFTMTRYASGIEPGALIEFVWSSWGSAATTYWRVNSVTDNQTTDGRIRVSCDEDLLAVPFRGIEAVFQNPETPHLIGEIRTPAEIILGDDATEELIGTFGPGQIYEPPGVMTAGTRNAVMGIQRADSSTTLASMVWEIDGSGDSNAMALSSPWAICGALEALVAISGGVDRTTTIDILLDYSGDMDDIVDACSYINATTDDFSDLTAGPYNLLFINDEIMRVGWAEDQGGGIVRLSGLVRGDFGTAIAAHADTDRIMFLERLEEANQLSWADIPQGEDIEFQADQVTNRGTIIDGATITFYGPATKQFTTRSLAPPTPIYLTDADASGTWTITMRPTFISNGAGTQPTLTQDLEDLITSLPSEHGLRVIAYSGGESEVPQGDTTIGERFDAVPDWMPTGVNVTSYAFTPDTGEPGSCELTLVMTPTGTATKVRIWTIINGVQSEDYIEITP